MNNSFVFFIKLILCFWLQCVMAQIWPIATPLVLLQFILLLTLERGSREGFFYGVAVGLLLDVFSSQKFGMNIFLYSGTAYSIGFFKETFFRENVFLKILLSLVGVSIFHILRVAFFMFFQSESYEGYFWEVVSLMSIFWTLLFIPFCDWLVYLGLGQKSRRVF